MKNNPRIFAIGLLGMAIAALTACDKTPEEVPAAKKYDLTVRITYPQDVQVQDVQGITITASNEKSQTYTIDTTAVSTVTMQVPAGQYSVMVTGTVTLAHSLNGTAQANIYDASTVNVALESVMKSPLIFRSIYYVTNNFYFNDTYFEIVNNSDEVQYLDQIMVGNMVALSKPTQWVDDNGNQLDRYPLSGYVCAFPGNGTQHPLQPGQSVLVCNDATDHSILKDEASPNLTGADWEAYFNDAGRFIEDVDYDAPNLDVVFTNGSSPRFFSGYFGSGMIMAKLPEGVTPAQFAADSANLMTIPKTSATTYHLMVPSKYVLDAVEMVSPDDVESGSVYKNILPKDDASYISMEAWSAKAIVRKSTTGAGGRVYYQDTNNSAADFLINQPLEQRP